MTTENKANINPVFCQILKMCGFFVLFLGFLSGCDLFDTEDPEIVILSPKEDDVITTTAFPVEGTAKDNVKIEKIEISIDGDPFVEIINIEDWIYNVEITTEGTHFIIAKATDTSGLEDSDTVTFTITLPND